MLVKSLASILVSAFFHAAGSQADGWSGTGEGESRALREEASLLAADARAGSGGWPGLGFITDQRGRPLRLRGEGGWRGSREEPPTATRPPTVWAWDCRSWRHLLPAA